MTETIPTRPFDEMEALAWLRSQPDGVVAASAADLGRRWGWNRMRTGRRLKAWEKAGLIRRNAEAIIATTSVASAVAGESRGRALAAQLYRGKSAIWKSMREPYQGLRYEEIGSG
jgi:hypothetical protein